MAAITFQLKYTNSSGDSATCVSAIQALMNLLAANGWTQTADTGQFDAGTFVWPGAATACYVIYRMNDALQSSMPVFLKLTFVIGGANTNIQPYIQVGTGSNGVGTLTGNVSGNYSMSGGWGSGDTSLRNCYASAGVGYFTFMTLCGISQAGVAAVERSVDSGGNFTASYVTLCVLAGNGTNASWTAPAPASGIAAPLGTIMWMLASIASTSYNGTALWCPVFPVRGALMNPMISMGICRTVEAGDQSTNTAQIYGVTHTYLFSSGTTPASNIANAAVGIRYE